MNPVSPSALNDAELGRPDPLLAEAIYLSSFLDARCLARISMLSQPGPRHADPVIALFATLATRVEEIAEARVSRLFCQHWNEGVGAGDADGERSIQTTMISKRQARAEATTRIPMPGIKLQVGALRRGELHSWLAALDELEAWDGLRQVGACCRMIDDSSTVGVAVHHWQLPANPVVWSHVRSLRDAEDLCRISFPSRSLCVFTETRLEIERPLNCIPPFDRYFSRISDFDAADSFYSWRFAFGLPVLARGCVSQPSSCSLSFHPSPTSQVEPGGLGSLNHGVL